MSAKADKSLTRMLIALILAVVILAGSVITAVAMIKQDEINNADENNTNADGMIDLIACEEEDIERVNIDSSRDTYSIIRDPADTDSVSWMIENRDNTDISQYNLMLLINRCTTLRALRDLGRAPSSEEDLALYGLDSASNPVRVSITIKDKGVYTYLIGSQYGTENQYYFMDASSSELYLGHQTIGTYFTRTVDEWRDLPTLDVQTGAMNYFTIDRKSDDGLTMIYNSDLISGENVWQIISPFLCDTDATKLNTFFESLAAITMSGYVAETAGEDWDKYGFEDYYLRLAMFQAELTEEGEPVIKENYPSQILIVGNPVEGSDDRYAILYSMHDDSGKLLESVDLKSLKVYTISSASVNLLRTDAMDIANLSFAMQHIDNMNSIDITIRGQKETIEITRKNKLDDDHNPILDASGENVLLTTFTLNGETLPEASMRAFYAKLISISLAARIQETDPQEYGEEVFSFSLNTTSFITDENGENIPYSVTASFYEMDMNYYMVDYNGYRVCKVRKDYIDDIIQSYYLAKEGELPPLRES